MASHQSHQTSIGFDRSEESLQSLVEAGLSDDPMTTGILQDLRDACRNGRCCPHAIRTSRSSGTTTWKVDPVNTKRARAACANLDEQSFGRQTRNNPFKWLANLRALCGDRWSLDARQLALARELHIIDKLPHMTEEEIEDLNKGDIFVKFLAVSQISWLSIQLITRVSRRLPTTQLEIVTLAFAVISVITYVLLYSRPKDVQTVREIDACRYPTPGELSQIAEAGPDVSIFRRDISIPNTSTPITGKNDLSLSIAASLAVFGGLHLLAWNYEFPTQIEKTLWQASAIVTIAAMPLVYALFSIPEHHRFASYHDVFMLLTIFGLLGALFAARAFILVQIVRSLAYQPPETFRATWAANVPHVG